MPYLLTRNPPPLLLLDCPSIRTRTSCQIRFWPRKTLCVLAGMREMPTRTRMSRLMRRSLTYQHQWPLHQRRRRSGRRARQPVLARRKAQGRDLTNRSCPPARRGSHARRASPRSQCIMHRIGASTIATSYRNKRCVIAYLFST